MSKANNILLAASIVIFGLVAAAIVIPNFMRARTTPASNACINNLRQMDGAIQQWALEQKKNRQDQVVWNDIMPYLKNQIVCQNGGKYLIGPVVSNGVTCSFPGHSAPP